MHDIPVTGVHTRVSLQGLAEEAALPLGHDSCMHPILQAIGAGQQSHSILHKCAVAMSSFATIKCGQKWIDVVVLY